MGVIERGREGRDTSAGTAEGRRIEKRDEKRREKKRENVGDRSQRFE